MATKAASKRLGKEAAMMEKDPPPLCYGRPREDNILEWHFILRGPPDTPYEGGEYWGQLLFPSDYPFKPPGIKVQTPSGRFQPDTKICTSMSDFHPGSWNPAWSVSSILVGLLSFMCTEEITTGSIMTPRRERSVFAAQSHAYNVRQRRFVQMFPEYATVEMRDLPNMSRPTKPPADAVDKAATQTEAPPASDAADENAAPAADAARSTGAAGADAAPGGGDRPFWQSRTVQVAALALVACLFASRVIEAVTRGA